MRSTARSFRRTALVITIMIPAAVSAQSVAIYGSAEAAGYGEGSLFVGTSVSASGLGWRPYAAIGAYTYRYQSGASSHSTNSAIAPSVGLVHNRAESSVQFGVGYVFAGDGAPPQTSSGAPLGSQSSPFVSGQYSYWGDGSKDVLLLGSYATKSQYIWTRGSALNRLGGPTGRLYAGGEVGLQGGMEDPSFFKIQAGPAISYRVSNSFRIGGAAGVRISTGDFAPPMTGYARIDVLLLPGR